MQPSPTPQAIICNSNGDLRAYAGTLAIAMAIFEDNIRNLGADVMEVIRAAEPDSGVFAVGPSIMQRVLTEILDLAAGADAPRCRQLFYGRAPKEGPDNRPVVKVGEDWAKELAVRLVEQGLTKQHLHFIAGGALAKLAPHTLSFMSPLRERIANRTVLYAYADDYFEIADRYRTIRTARWKPTAPEAAVIKSILEFVNEYLVDIREVRFAISEISETY